MRAHLKLKTLLFSAGALLAVAAVSVQAADNTGTSAPAAAGVKKGGKGNWTEVTKGNGNSSARPTGIKGSATAGGHEKWIEKKPGKDSTKPGAGRTGSASGMGNVKK